MNKSKEVSSGKKIYIRCFGKFAIYWKGEELSLKMNSLKARELIAFLTVYRGRTVRKETVYEAIWGDKNTTKSQDSLYKLVRKISNMPFPFYLEYKRGMIRLDTRNIESDIYEFEDLILQKKNISDLEKAIDLYTGSLYGDESFNWIMDQDGYYEKLYLQAISKLITHYRQEGKTSELKYCEIMEKGLF